MPNIAPFPTVLDGGSSITPPFSRRMRRVNWNHGDKARPFRLEILKEIGIISSDFEHTEVVRLTTVSVSNCRAARLGWLPSFCCGGDWWDGLGVVSFACPLLAVRSDRTALKLCVMFKIYRGLLIGTMQWGETFTYPAWRAPRFLKLLREDGPRFKGAVVEGTIHQNRKGKAAGQSAEVR